MVKKLILIATLLFVYTFSSAQTIQDVFNGYLLPITHAGKSGDTLIFRGKFINAQGKYDGTELNLGDVVIAETDGQCYYMPIVNIDVKGAVITASILDATSTLATVPDGLAAIGRLTQYKALFPQVAGITSTLNSCIQNYNNAILDKEEIPDTISQAHNFPIGTAVWDSSGVWVKTYDYTRDIPVDAIVVDSISSTVFAVQYRGRFRLPNHGYTIGKQLYVQPNGTYSLADTSNHITYGYALDSVYIEIKNKSVTTDLVNERSNWYPNVTYIQNDVRNYAGDLYKLTASTSRNERPDTSSNWSKITTTSPTSGSGNEFEIPFFDNTTTNLSTDTGLKYQNDTLKTQKFKINNVPIIDNSGTLDITGGVRSSTVDNGYRNGSNEVGSFLSDLYNRKGEPGYIDDLIGSDLFLGKDGQTIKQTNSEARYKVIRELPPDATIDSVVYYGPLDAINITSENLFRQSENVVPQVNNGWISTGGGRIRAIGIDSIADPFGKITAEVLDPDGTSSYKAMRQVIASGDTIRNTEQYYLSFWFKAVSNMNTSGYSIDFSIANISGTDFTEVTNIPLNTSDTQWRYYQVEVPQFDSSYFTNPYEFKFRFQGFLFNGTETFSMSRMSFTRDSTYEYVPALNDSILPRYRAYAELFIPTKIVNWSELPFYLITDQQKWDYLEVMGQRKIIKGVFIDDVVTLTQPFNRPEGFSIYGNYTGGQVRPENYPLEDYIIVDLNDPNADAIVGTELTGETVYVSGELENLLIHVVSPCRAVINENEGLRPTITNVLVDCDYEADYGIYISNEEFGANNVVMNSPRVFRAKQWALWLDSTGAITKIYDAQFHRSKNGIKATGSFVCEGCQIEKIDSLSVFIDMPGVSARFYNTYIEGGNYDLDFDNTDNGGDSTIIKVDQARLFRFDGGFMSGADSTKHFFELDSVELADISFNRNINQGIENDDRFILLKNPGYTDLRTLQNFGDSGFGNRVDDFNIDRGTLDTVDVENSEMRRSEIFTSNVTDGSSLNGDLSIDQMYLSGRRENLIANSTAYATLSDDFSTIDTIQNFYRKDSSATVFRLDSTIVSGSTAFITVNSSSSLQVDSVYTFSFYAKKINQEPTSPSMTIISRHADDSGTQVSHTLTGEWVRYSNTFTAASTNVALRIRVDNDNRVNNTFSVSDFQLVKGSNKKSYISTNGTAIDDHKSTIVVLDDDNNLDIEGGLIASTVTNPYGGSNEIGAVINALSLRALDYKFQKEVNNISIQSDSIATYEKYNLIIKNDTIGKITRIGIPEPNSTINGRSFIVIDSSKFDAKSYIESDGGLILKYGDQYVSRYNLDPGEIVNITYTDSTAVIQTNIKPKTISTTSDISNGLFFENQEFNYKNGSYKLQKSPPSYGIDNIFVIPVQEKAPYGENLILNSEEILHQGAGIGQWNISDAIRPATNSTTKDKAFNLDGTMTADALIADASGTKRISQAIDFKVLGGLNPGDNVTFSFWVKQANAASNDNAVVASVRMSPSGQSETSKPGFTPNKEWQQVSTTFTPVLGIDTTVLMFAYFTMDIGDTLFITRAQVERTPSASNYKTTTANQATASDSSYAVLQIEEKTLDLNSLYRGNDESDTQVLRTAVNYCETTGLCNKIKVFDGMILTDTLLLPEYMELIGDGSSNTEVFIDLNDSSKSAIFCERGLIAARGQKVSGITFTPISDAFAIINANNALSQYYHDISMTGSYNEGVDSVAYGFYIGSATGDASIYSHIESSTVLGFGTAGIHYEDCGNLHELKDVISSRNRVGIQGSATILKIDLCDIEANDIALNLYNLGQVEVTNTYIENGYCSINNVLLFSYKEGRISGGGFEITDVKSIELSRNRLSTGAYVYESITNTIDPSVEIKGNYFQSTFDYFNMRSRYCGNPGSNIQGNFHDEGIFLEGCAEGLRVQNTSIQSIALFGNNFIGDTLRVADYTLLYGIKQNLWPKSDSIYNADGVTSGEIEIQNNVAVAPDGTMTADRYIGLSTTSGTASFGTIPLGETINTGDKTIISVWAKAESHNPTARFTFRYGSTESFQIGPFLSNEWKRYDIVVGPSTTNTSTLTRRRSSTSVGDSILFWGWQVNRGDRLLSYQPTTGSSINTTGPALFEAPNGLDFVGTVTNVDSLKWTHYSSITNGDTITFNTDKNVIYLGAGDSVYVDESGLTSDAILKVIQSSGIGTVFKVDGLSNRFYELGTNRSYSKTIGTGSVKELFYNKATNHWYTTSYYQSDIPIEDVATTTDTIVVYRGMEIAMDGTSGSYTVQLDLSELNEGESFNIKVDDIGASTVTVDVLNEASVVQYEGNPIAATHGFTGSYAYVHCSWRGGVLYITR